jgi:selenocysteine lyase/cysteine desulfurase
MRDRTRDLHAGLAAMAHYEEGLSERLISGLAAIEGVRIHGITDPTAYHRRVPTVSMTVDGMDPALMAGFLGDRGVYVWNGHSYGLPVVEWLGLADRGGVVRIGPTHYNTVDEIDTAVGLVAEFLGRR